nr:nickel pincer cofactor biosynthesis protein LarC [Oscillospiraceae bacterium]
MMKTLYFDCSMGAAGDMLTAALLDLFDDPAPLVRELNHAFAGRAVLTLLPDQKCGISGKHVRVEIEGEVEGEEDSHHHHHHHHHTSLTEVRSFLSCLPLSKAVIADALAVYDRIAAAEAQVHGKEISNIHFHEVGSLDAMADVVSVCFLIRRLNPEQILASPVHVGSGTVRCAHGELPVPAPATLLLLKDIPVYSSDVQEELCTPTGAALLGHFVSRFGNLPLMRVSGIGYGTGFKDFQRANILRALLGDTDESPEQVVELSCNLDDMTAEELAFAQERLFAAGALDVWFTSIGMKKSRPGVMLTCVSRPDDRD